MIRRALALLGTVLVLLVAPRAAGAQANTAETLRGAVRLYEDLQVERAVALLRQVVSPSTPFEVSREQRVTAYKYLGAALAVLGQRDSAVVYLRAAIERDPFTDMDVQRFSPVEREALAEARQRTFALAAEPVEPVAFDPRTARMTVTVLTTHAAQARVEIRGAGAGVGAAETATLLEGELTGLRELPWSGVLADGRLAPPGRYALLVTGSSRQTGRTDSARVWFDVRHDRPTLEDTIPPLTAADLLPERMSTATASRDLLRGFGVAAAALLAHAAVADRRLEGSGRYVGVAAATGVLAGGVSFLVRQRNPTIPDNIAENARRHRARALHNAEVRQRNAVRIAATRLVVAPAAGAAP
jgi:hypothetical protein